MARKVCTTTQGDSVCCVAAQRGALGRVFTFTTRSGSRRCGQCDLITKRNGQPGFRFRFHKSAECGIVGGCAALAGAAGGGTLALPQQGQQSFLPTFGF